MQSTAALPELVSQGGHCPVSKHHIVALKRMYLYRRTQWLVINAHGIKTSFTSDKRGLIQVLLAETHTMPWHIAFFIEPCVRA